MLPLTITIGECGKMGALRQKNNTDYIFWTHPTHTWGWVYMFDYDQISKCIYWLMFCEIAFCRRSLVYSLMIAHISRFIDETYRNMNHHISFLFIYLFIHFPLALK